MSTRIISGPICRIFLKGISISGSQFKKLNILFPPGTIILQIHPLQASNSRLHTLPSFLQSLMLITSLHFNSEKSIAPLFPFIFSHCLSTLYEKKTSFRTNIFRAAVNTTSTTLNRLNNRGIFIRRKRAQKRGKNAGKSRNMRCEYCKTAPFKGRRKENPF